MLQTSNMLLQSVFVAPRKITWDGVYSEGFHILQRPVVTFFQSKKNVHKQQWTSKSEEN